jgi:hypothetical protein
MLVRQKILLALLSLAKTPVSLTVLAGLTFLFRQEMDSGKEMAFYDFLPYKHGPYSFSLHHELGKLSHDGYVTVDDESVALSGSASNLVEQRIGELPAKVRKDIEIIAGKYGSNAQKALLEDILSRYSWYAAGNKRSDSKSKRAVPTRKAKPAIYTVGYEGKSLDGFFNHLLEQGIELVIDVRANPLSRHYGFSKGQFSGIAEQLGIGYHPASALGIPRKYRADMTDADSRRRLLDKYEKEILPQHGAEVDEVGALMSKTPAALMCMEKDIQCCHRSRLAEVLARKTGLEVKHI